MKRTSTMEMAALLAGSMAGSMAGRGSGGHDSYGAQQ